MITIEWKCDVCEGGNKFVVSAGTQMWEPPLKTINWWHVCKHCEERIVLRSPEEDAPPRSELVLGPEA